MEVNSTPRAGLKFTPRPKNPVPDEGSDGSLAELLLPLLDQHLLRLVAPPPFALQLVINAHQFADPLHA